VQAAHDGRWQTLQVAVGDPAHVSKRLHTDISIRNPQQAG
jgi:hypothetical protein